MDQIELSPQARVVFARYALVVTQVRKTLGSAEGEAAGDNTQPGIAAVDESRRFAHLQMEYPLRDPFRVNLETVLRSLLQHEADEQARRDAGVDEDDDGCGVDADPLSELELGWRCEGCRLIRTADATDPVPDEAPACPACSRPMGGPLNVAWSQAELDVDDESTRKVLAAASCSMTGDPVAEHTPTT